MLEQLLKDLKSGDIEQKAATAVALAKLGDQRAVEPLIKALSDKDTGVQYAVVTALGALGDPRAVQPLLAVLRRTPGDTWVDQAAGLALGRLGVEAVPELMVALADKQENILVRAWAARALGTIGDKRAVALLKETLLDENAHVQEASAEGLEQLEYLQKL